MKLSEESVVTSIVEAMRKEIKGNESRPFSKEKEFFAKIGMTEGYKQYCKNIETRAQTRLKQATDRLGEIFNPINKEVCGKCKNNDRGCCSDCGRNHGHFNFNHSANASRKEIEKLAATYGYRIFDGFWTEKGCSLPREKRSITCLSHYCDTMAKSMTKEQRIEVSELIDIIRNSRYVIKANLI